ncbi:MAG: hypothetical protein DMD36_16150 [Gemmatimonadetes bacterium]|nr:MAG: hypothetical protein DMD36_16150 [Gemmatimonadota bacterium]
MPPALARRGSDRRAAMSLSYPARFMLAAAMNPCPPRLGVQPHLARLSTQFVRSCSHESSSAHLLPRERRSTPPPPAPGCSRFRLAAFEYARQSALLDFRRVSELTGQCSRCLPMRSPTSSRPHAPFFWPKGICTRWPSGGGGWTRVGSRAALKTP